MSYTYVSAVTRATRTTPDWVPTDIRQMTLTAILNQFYQVQITLTDSFSPQPVYLTQDGLRQVMPMSIPTPTFATWLAGLGNASLPTLITQPISSTNPVGYSDAWQAGYVANLADINRSTGTQMTPSGLNDLLLTKAGLDMASMSHYLLTTVNGYLHLSGGSVNGMYVIDGGKSGRIAGNNHIGVLSFYHIGQVTQIPITSDMLYKPNPTLSYAQHVHVDLGVSLTGKIVLLSLGGYLHALDGAYDKVGDSVIKINMHDIRLPERLYQSGRVIDLSSLPLDRGPSGPTSLQYGVASLHSDAVIAAYLTLSQSFAIVVDAANFYTKRHDLEMGPSAGRYFGNLLQRFPLVGPYGRMYDYRLSQEEDTFVYGCEPMMQDHYLFQSTNWRNQLSIGPGRDGSRPWSNGKAALLEMGSFV